MGQLGQVPLLAVIRLADSVDSFKARLETDRFAKAYPIILLVVFEAVETPL